MTTQISPILDWTWETLNQPFVFYPVGLVLCLSFWARANKNSLVFNYKAGPINDTFLKRSKIKQLSYTPYIWAVNNHVQAILYTIIDMV